jgi:hypothetical protein
MVEDHEAGFKLVYAVCRDTGKKAVNDGSACSDDGSYDWSDSRGAPYHWFSDMQSCEDAQFSIYKKKPDDVKIDEDRDVFVSACVPAPKINGHVVTGYEMVFALIAPGAEINDASHAELRQIGSNAPTVFKTFEACYDAIDTVYSKFPNDLGVDEDGNVLSDDTKSIQITGNCVRVY